MTNDDEIVTLAGNYTQVPNARLEPELTRTLSGLQHQVLNLILRGTLGYRRRTTQLDVSKLARRLGVHRTNVRRALKELARQGLILVREERSEGVGQTCTGVGQTRTRLVAISHQIAPVSGANSHTLPYNKEKNIKKGKESSPSTSLRTEKDNPYRPITREDVVENLQELSSVLAVQKALGGALTEAMCENFWQALCKLGWGVSRLREVFRIARQTRTFFPTIAELLHIADQNPGAGRPPDDTGKLKPEDEATEEEFQQSMAELRKMMHF